MSVPAKGGEVGVGWAMVWTVVGEAAARPPPIERRGDIRTRLGSCLDPGVFPGPFSPPPPQEAHSMEHQVLQTALLDPVQVRP